MPIYLGPILGGALLGVASSGMLLVLGRVTGISGIIAHLRPSQGAGWRLLFLCGLIFGGLCISTFSLASFGTPSALPWPLVIVSGLLVGFGSSLGNGCTSGHGVCGIPRLSPRSIVSTAVFISTGMLTVVVMHLFGGAS